MKERLAAIAGIVFDYMVKHENFGRTVTLKIKTPDFKIITRSRTFGGEVRTLEALQSAVHELLISNVEELEAVRLLGITVSNLEKEHIGEGVQLEFDFGEGQ